MSDWNICIKKNINIIMTVTRTFALFKTKMIAQQLNSNYVMYMSTISLYHKKKSVNCIMLTGTCHRAAQRQRA